MAFEDVHAEFRTVVPVGEALMVTGTLPGTQWRPEGRRRARRRRRTS
jgi:hypothetical protein